MCPWSAADHRIIDTCSKKWWHLCLFMFQYMNTMCSVLIKACGWYCLWFTANTAVLTVTQHVLQSIKYIIYILYTYTQYHRSHEMSYGTLGLRCLLWKDSAQSDVSFCRGPSGGGWNVRISLKVSPGREEKVGQERQKDRKKESINYQVSVDDWWSKLLDEDLLMGCKIFELWHDLDIW